MEMGEKPPGMRHGEQAESRIPAAPDENRKQVIATVYTCEKIPKTSLLTGLGGALIIGSECSATVISGTPGSRAGEPKGELAHAEKSVRVAPGRWD
jgi:hypothetical protein